MSDERSYPDTMDELRDGLAAIRDRVWRDDETYEERIGDLKFLAAKTLSDTLIAGQCTCQDQHRLGYCMEPGCPFALAQKTGNSGALSRDALIEIIMRETTDDIVADGWDHLGKPNVLVQGCKFIRRNARTEPTEGYAEPEVAARRFAAFVADAILAATTVQSSWQPDEGTTCYLERSKVREILIGVPDENLHISELILSLVDELPIFTSADMAASGQWVSNAVNALEMVRDANRDEPHIPPTALATIEAVLAEHELMRRTLETIAGRSADQLQATQARGALANIGPSVSSTSQQSAED